VASDVEDSAAAAALTLRDVLAEAGQLTLDQRKLIVDQALTLLSQAYVHLHLKRAMHGIDPEQRLRLLRRRLDSTDPSFQLSERRFHDELIAVFTSLRDLHTTYSLPDPYASKVAYVPILIEEYWEGDERHYLVTGERVDDPDFTAGVLITDWNGIPIDRAVELNADRNAGSNPAARHARGLENLTIRPMSIGLPPDEEWVIIGYEKDGQRRELRLPWSIFVPAPAPEAVQPGGVHANGLGLDPQGEAIRRARKELFRPDVLARELELADISTTQGAADAAPAFNPATDSVFPDNLAFRTVQTQHGPMGYLRIWSFMQEDVRGFLGEVIRILGLLPQTGLIIDVRGNGGGVIVNGEWLLQMLTPRPIQTERLQFVNSPLTLRLASRDEYAPWRPSMEQALETGADYSQGLPLVDDSAANTIGQVYQGPVVLVTDARCYSTTDIFSAGFADHAIGPILGTDRNTGAGGANVFDYADLLSDLGPGGPLQPLPANASFTVAMRRTTRVGKLMGTPVEDLGVQPDEVHQLTRNDLLNGNPDLIEHAAALLAAVAPRHITATRRAGAALAFDATVAGVTRIDVFLDDRPRLSLDVADGPLSIEPPALTPPPKSATFRGYSGDSQLAAVLRLDLE
jgi:hypothetical protein